MLMDLLVLMSGNAYIRWMCEELNSNSYEGLVLGSDATYFHRLKSMYMFATLPNLL